MTGMLLWSAVALATPPAIVPGCPSEENGSLSQCQWRRVVWAHHLWASGQVSALIPSGNAVYNRFVEADAMAAALVALGVLRAAIWPEPRALHTDENIAYALRITGARGIGIIAIASDPWQANGGYEMVHAWTHHDTGCVSFPMDYPLVQARLAHGVPDVRTEPVPAGEWLTLAQREAANEAITGWKRPPSLILYYGNAVKRVFGMAKPPVLPQ